MATGRYPHETRYWDNCLAYDGRFPSWMGRVRDQGHTVASIGKLHFRSTDDDNGFSTEIAPMHIVNGVGGLVNLLRWSEEEPVLTGQWELYAEESGVGGSVYQDYDREITRLAIDWLGENGRQSAPWALFVSYPSVHPPFSVPQRLWDLYPVEDMPLPVRFRPGERLEHPALAHLRKVLGYHDMVDEAMLRRVAAGYFALITHLDEQIGKVFQSAEDLGLLDSTRVLYTSDHGESFGNNGLFGKFQLLETGVAVPLLVCGPDVPEGGVVKQIASHVDLFPTIVESCGASMQPEDGDLPGASLWPAIYGDEREQIGWAEYHAGCSRASSFMLREGDWKLILHVGMPNQLFNLRQDPFETVDLVAEGSGIARAAQMEARLRGVVDPEAVDGQARDDQRRRAEAFGGNEAIRTMGVFPYTPPPGVEPEMMPTE